KKLCRAGKNYADCVRSNPSGSLAKYYNYAFSKATSEYVMKCDANYIFTLKGKIDIINALNKNPDVLCYPGVEIFGHHHSIEPFVYLRKLNYKYCDGLLWEFLHYERTAKIKKILNPCFVHIKRINYNKYIHSEHKGVDGLYGSHD
ncbi:glycosyltransferase, partial [Escherichia coli]|nr:glycosyltransferase [Escherichia coli]